MQARTRHSFAPRLLAIILLGLAASSQLGSDNCQPGPLAPLAGLREKWAPTVVSVPGGVANTAGGNLHVARVDFSIDTKLGTYELGAAWNSATRSWLWSFDIRYDATTFTDPTGGAIPVGSIANGAPVPGTHWVKVDSSTLRTKGGLVHEFSAAGQLAALRRSNLNYPRLKFLTATIAGSSRIERVQQCEAATDCTTFFTINYDASTGRVLSIDDRAGRTGTFSYYSDGRLWTAKSPLDVAKGYAGRRYEYEVNGDLKAQTTSSQVRVEYTYDGTKRIKLARLVGAPTYENIDYSFDYSANRTDLTRPSGARFAYGYDGSRRLTQRTNLQTGDTWTWAWTGERPSQLTLAGNVVTGFTFTNDDLTEVRESSGNVIQISYQPGAVNREDQFATPIATVTDSLGLVEQRQYNGLGQLITLTNGEGEATQYTYNTEGLLKTITKPSGETTTLSDFAKHGHPRMLDTGDLTARFDYDAEGNLLQGPAGDDSELSSSPSIGGIESRRFDQNRNVIEVTLANQDANGQAFSREILEVERRADGQIARIRRPFNGDWEFAYDTRGLVTERRELVDGIWRPTEFEYDAAGRRKAIEQANGMRSEWTYDTSDRLATIKLKEDGILQATETRSYQAGRLTSATDTSWGGSEAYSYEATIGRLVRIDYPGGEYKELEYDLRSRPKKTRYRNATTAVITEIQTDFDLANRNVAVWDRGVRVVKHEYAQGKVTTDRYGNGLVRTYAYDADLGFVSGSTTRNAATQVIESSTVDWNLTAFQVDALTTTNGGVNASKREVYTLGPLWGSSATPGLRVWKWSPDGTSGDEYKYDELTNIRSIDSGQTQFNYNSERNRLLSTSGIRSHSYVYDEAGFVTSRNGVVLDWDAGGRIKAIGSTTSFQWDVQGRPTSRRLNGGSTDEYAFGGAMRVSGSAQNPIQLNLGEVQVRFDLGQRFYLHTDFRNNVKFVTDNSGTVLVHYRYDAYGLDWVQGTTQAEGEFAQGVVGATGVVVLGTRAYDPDIGRFLSPDPILQLVNQYAYAMGNPTLLWDPGGTDAVSTEIKVAAMMMVVGEGVALAGEHLATKPSPGTVAGGLILVVLGRAASRAGLVLFVWYSVEGGVSGPGGDIGAGPDGRLGGPPGFPATGPPPPPPPPPSPPGGPSGPPRIIDGVAFPDSYGSGGYCTGMGLFGGYAPSVPAAHADLGRLLIGFMPLSVFVGLRLAYELRRSSRLRKRE